MYVKGYNYIFFFLFWDESGLFFLKFVLFFSRILTKCESILVYKIYLYVIGIIVYFLEFFRCIRKLNWSDFRFFFCFWLIELCEKNKNLDLFFIFC